MLRRFDSVKEDPPTCTNSTTERPPLVLTEKDAYFENYSDNLTPFFTINEAGRRKLRDLDSTQL